MDLYSSQPTNDVDLDTLRALEGYLEDYKGVLVIVSHDRLFTDKVTDHLFVFEGDGVVKDYLGSLSDYAECLVERRMLLMRRQCLIPWLIRALTRRTNKNGSRGGIVSKR